MTAAAPSAHGETLDAQARAAVKGLAVRAASVRCLSQALPRPCRVALAGSSSRGGGREGDAVAPEGLFEFLQGVLTFAGVTGLTLDPQTTPADLGPFERVLSDRLDLASTAAGLAASCGGDTLVGAERFATAALRDTFESAFAQDVITSADGLALRTFGAGPDRDPVVIVPACGMPAALAESWMRVVARRRRVLTWESRGLFDGGGDGDFDVDPAAQARDLVAVMDHHGVTRAHVVGLCGGAVVALAAAAAAPDRIRSLSLWNGAYQFGADSPRTRFQHDLIELMTVAAGSRTAARSVQGVLAQLALTGTPVEVAHLVLYPYANPELFYRYCRLNGALARTDVRPYLRGVGQPTMVVSSRGDDTADPRGSELLAAALPNATLRIGTHGNHANLFVADEGLVRVATDFIEACSAVS